MASELESVDRSPRFDAPGPYDAFDDESDAEFLLAKAYFDLGPKRSLRRLADATGASLTRVQGLAKRHSWVARADALDEETIRQATREIEGGTAEMRERHAEAAKLGFDIVMEGMKNIRPEFLSTRDMAALLDITSKLERMSRGVQETKRVEVTGKDGGPIELVAKMDPEERRALMRDAQAELARRLAGTVTEEVIEGEIVSESQDGPEDH